MKFGAVPVVQAEGAMLAHSLKLPSKRLKKGHVLTKDDLKAIVAAGEEEVTVARLEAGDIDENGAAGQLAIQLAGGDTKAAKAFTGRANLYATQTGILQVQAEVINAINRVDSTITVATLANGSFVGEGRMVATVKIIPLAVRGEVVSETVTLAQGGEAISIASSSMKTVGLIQTTLPSVKPSVLDKTRRILEARLKSSNSDDLYDELRVAHKVGEVTGALKRLKDCCDLIVVFGASAIVDSADIIPAAIEKAGGQIDYLGMPVDPGNLLLIGRFLNEPDDVIVIGAPGCARSPAENGFDWVLQRVIADLPVTPNYISGLGVGGLLMEITERPQPRDPA